MGLRITPEPTFAFTAELTVPGADEPARVSFTARYQSPEQHQAWLDRLQVSSPDPAQWLGEVIVGWGVDIVDDKGAPVAFSTEALRTLIGNYHAAALELLQQYHVALTGSRRKNSSPPLLGSTASR